MSKGRDHVTIMIEELVSQRRNPTPPIIFKVDNHLRQGNEEDYEPQLISIGPIHHGKDQFKRMEQDKAMFLQKLLEEIPDLIVAKLVESLREMEASARHCYSESFNLDSDKFVKMLLLDACFIIQLVRNHNPSCFYKSDKLIRIRHDLMLLENQLPFFVLQNLFYMIKKEENLHCLIISFVTTWWNFTDVPSFDRLVPPPYHLLGLVHAIFSPISAKDWKVQSLGTVHINSASELKEAGIRLKKSKDTSLTFAAGVLNCPSLSVSRTTQSFLRNMMTYEQLQHRDGGPRYVTNYIRFMHFLVRSTKDIEILRRKWIIYNFLGGDDMILQMFDRLEINFIASSKFCYSNVFESVNDHCRRRRKTWIAKLRKNYLDSPWSVLKVLVGTLLLLLAIAQTVSSVLSLTNRNTL